MRAMRLTAPRRPLEQVEIPDPEPDKDQVLVRVEACGVCRTDLHVLDGELPQAHYPVTPGHEVVGRVQALGRDVVGLALNDRVGVPWMAHTCGHCLYCRSNQENLCDTPAFTGCSQDGGFATHVLAHRQFILPLPATGDPAHMAPWLCAGLIGWRALRMAGDGQRLGLYGFGASAHLIAQVARHQGREVFAFTRPGDMAGQAFARTLGAVWAGSSDEAPPCPLDAAIIFASVGALVPMALGHVRKAGRVVCAGIHMSDIPAFAYERLWGERRIVSVANLTRQDGLDFLDEVAQRPIVTHVTCYPLARANDALDDLREGRFSGAAVLVP